MYLFFSKRNWKLLVNFLLWYLLGYKKVNAFLDFMFAKVSGKCQLLWPFKQAQLPILCHF